MHKRGLTRTANSTLPRQRNDEEWTFIEHYFEIWFSDHDEQVCKETHFLWSLELQNNQEEKHAVSK
jgi:hypothetical protein